MGKKSQKTAKTRRETAVQGTNDSSVLSKSSAACMGYFNDPFIHLFCGKKVRRSPMINRGYYIRAKCLDMVIKNFLLENAAHKKQIISLGSGYDSLFFRLKHEGLLQDTVIVEMDFPDLMQKKLQMILSKPELSQLLSPDTDFTPSTPHLALDSVDLKMVGMDICRVSELDSVLAACKVSFSEPTLFISEVVLTYINKTSTEQILKWASHFQDASFVLYEQINPCDGFGQVMLRHFEKIGSPLKCIHDYPTEEAQRERFLALGWKQCETYDLNCVYNYALAEEDREMVDSLEPFDEFEEWHSKCSHYILLLAHSQPKPYFIQAPASIPKPVSQQAQDVIKLVPCKVFPEEALATFQRYGHTSTLVCNRLLVVVGGFGVQDGQHQRMSDIGVLDVWTGHAAVVKTPKDLGHEVARMYHSSCIDKDGRIQIVGGRFSPTKTPETVLSLALKISDGEIEDGTSGGKVQLHTENIQTVACNPADIPMLEDSLVEKGNSKDNPATEEVQPPEDDTQAKTYTLKASPFAEREKQVRADETKAVDPCKVSQEAQTAKDTKTVRADGSTKSATKGATGGKDTSDAGQIPVRTLWPVGKEQLAALYRDLSAHPGPEEHFQQKFDQFLHRNPAWDSKMLKHVVACAFHGDVDLCFESLPELNCVPLKAAPSLGVEIKRAAEPAPIQKWRQAAVSFYWNGSAKLVLHGGINQQRKVMGDSHVYDLHRNTWSPLSCGGEQPGLRHSHTLSLWKEDMLVLAGGLTENQQPTNQVHLLSLSKQCWSRLDISGVLLPRSGHCAHVKDNLLFLVGGVQQQGFLPSIGVVNLDSGQATEVPLPSSDAEGNLVLYYGVTGVALGSSHLLMVGGGSSCFSFGSHHNHIYIINLDSIAQLVKL